MLYTDGGIPFSEYGLSTVAEVYMSNGYAMKAGPPPPATPAGLEEEFLNDTIPLIDSTYRTFADQSHRAMAGLSMGSAQTLQITTAHLDKFGYIGAFSGANFGGGPVDLKTAYSGAFADPAAFSRKVKVLFVGIGTAEPDRIRSGVLMLHETLEKAGVKHIFYEAPGTAHEWQTWRKDLYQVCSRTLPEGTEVTNCVSFPNHALQEEDDDQETPVPFDDDRVRITVWRTEPMQGPNRHDRLLEVQRAQRRVELHGTETDRRSCLHRRPSPDDRNAPRWKAPSAERD